MSELEQSIGTAQAAADSGRSGRIRNAARTGEDGVGVIGEDLRRTGRAFGRRSVSRDGKSKTEHLLGPGAGWLLYVVVSSAPTPVA